MEKYTAASAAEEYLAACRVGDLEQLFQIIADAEEDGISKEAVLAACDAAE